jgi:hypothetical protein
VFDVVLKELLQEISRDQFLVNVVNQENNKMRHVKLNAKHVQSVKNVQELVIEEE